MELWFEEVEVEVEVFLAAVFFFFFRSSRRWNEKRNSLSLFFSLSLASRLSRALFIFALHALHTLLTCRQLVLLKVDDIFVQEKREREKEKGR